MTSSNRALQIQGLPTLLRAYLHIAKPGIVLGNVLALLGGFLLASKGNIDPSLLAATLIGAVLVMGSGCVFNNCIDRDLDRLMKRTQDRDLVKGTIIMPIVYLYGTLLGIVGIVLLYALSTTPALIAAIAGWLIYVVAYSLYFKRNSVHGTVVGSFSGALPPVIGYLAVTGQVDLGAIILFVTFCLWQMPHFYAIAILGKEDYTRAKVPVLPVVRGNHVTKWQIIIYMILFTIASSMLTVFKYTGYAYLIVALGIGIGWIYLGFKGLITTKDKLWAKRVFQYSLLVVIALSIAMALDYN